MKEPVSSLDPEIIARRVAARCTARRAVSGNRALDFTLDALLTMDEATGRREYRPYVLSIVNARHGPPAEPSLNDSHPFFRLDYKLFQATGDRRYVATFVEECARRRREAGRSPEGAVTLDHGNPGRHVRLDILPDYMVCMAQTGILSQDESFLLECVTQCEAYRHILRDPATGLWSQGRGWMRDPVELSPGAWSRGHGALLRGIVAALDVLPRTSSYFAEMQGHLWETADSLLKRQDAEGMWHQLLHLPAGQSDRDAAGTGLVCCALARALHQGYLAKTRYRRAANRAFQGVARCVTEEGLVTHVSPDPGPLRSVANYLGKPGATEDGEGFGPAAVIMACAGRVLLDQPPLQTAPL